MENESLPSDGWNNVTTSSSKDDDLTTYLANIRDLALKVVYLIIGTVGVLDNLFVLVVFVLFIKITGKVLSILNKPECGPMPNVMVALPNIGGALCSTPQFG